MLTFNVELQIEDRISFKKVASPREKRGLEYWIIGLRQSKYRKRAGKVFRHMRAILAPDALAY